MNMLDKSLSVPKETAEAIDFIKAIAEKIKAGEKLIAYTDLVDEAMIAFQGADQIGAEVKSEHKEDILAYLVKQVGGVFL